MARRFVKESPVQVYRRKSQALIFSLSGLLLIMGTGMFFLVTSLSDKEEPRIEAKQQETVEILVSTKRVESGAKLKEGMFRVQTVLVDNVPTGAVYGNSKDLVFGQYMTASLRENAPLRTSLFASTRPSFRIKIPDGFRAISIDVDRRMILSGQVNPNSRVDILYLSTNVSGELEISPLVPFAKVLSVGGNDNPEQKGANPHKTTVELLVSEAEALKVELARKTGSLSLSLLGENSDKPLDPSKPVPRIAKCELTNECPKPKPTKCSGKMKRRNPQTGQIEAWCLRKEGWERV